MPAHATDESRLRSIRIGMIGCGVVGSGLAMLLEKHRADFARNGIDLKLARVAVRDASKPRTAVSGAEITTDAMAVANDPGIDLLVEVMGGDGLAVEAGCAALARGIPLVSANKAALSRHMPRYAEAALQGNAAIGFEAACAAHIPIIETLERSLACEELSLVKGVINGSTNYILTFMERAGCEYGQALADAAAKGFTEADPTLDVEGIDAAEKLSLLALKAFGVWVHPIRVSTQGITAITQADIRLATSLDHRIKLIASARLATAGLSLRVHPALIHRGELLADVDSEFNAIILEGPSFNQLTFLGKGAGQLPTASAVLNDIVRLVRFPTAGSLPGFARSNTGMRVQPTDDSGLCYFARAEITPGSDESIVEGCKSLGLPILRHSAIDLDGRRYLGVITDIVAGDSILEKLKGMAKLPGVIGAPAALRLDKDNYRDIVEREQDSFFGSSIQRESGTGV